MQSGLSLIIHYSVIRLLMGSIYSIFVGFRGKFQAQFKTVGRHAINSNQLLSVDRPRADEAWTIGKRFAKS